MHLSSAISFAALVVGSAAAGCPYAERAATAAGCPYAKHAAVSVPPEKPAVSRRGTN